MDLLYLISLLLLIIIVILITIYVTKVNSNAYMTCKDIKKLEDSQKLNNINNVYDFKISKEFDKMFNQSDLFTKYQSLYDDDVVKININK